MAEWEYARVLVELAGTPPEYDPYPLGGPFGQPPVLLLCHIPASGDLTVAKASVERGCGELRRQGWQPHSRHMASARATLVFRRPVATP